MFGHDDNQSSTDTGTTQPTQPQDGDPAVDGSLTADNSTAVATDAPSDATPLVHPTEEHQEPTSDALPDLTAPTSHQGLASVAADSGMGSEDDTPPSAPEPENEQAPAIDLPTPVSDNADSPAAAPAATPEELLSIKQEALQQLSPLVGHLDQTPEEKFHTSMMMIQASDDQSLIQTAFEAAKEITDDKTRAQALLDIINEINYFTQHQPAEQ